jgi:hypothetical protein
LRGRRLANLRLGLAHLRRQWLQQACRPSALDRLRLPARQLGRSAQRVCLPLMAAGWCCQRAVAGQWFRHVGCS